MAVYAPSSLDPDRDPGVNRRRLLDEGTAQTLRRSLTLLALAPLTMLIGTRVGHLIDDPVLGVYGLLMLCVLTTVLYLAFARYRDPSLDSCVPVDEPLVTCLLAVRDDRDVIERCVDSILASSYPNIELIVVDDGSTDGTRELLEQRVLGEPRFRLLCLPQSVGKKRALSAAALHARGDYLVFTDSDCVLADDAVERVMRAFGSNPEIGAVSGHARALNAERNFLTKVQDTWYEGQFSVWKAAESVYGGVTCISGPLAAFRRQAIYNYFPAWASDRFLGREFRFATDRQLTGYVLGSDAIGDTLKRTHADSPFVRERGYATRRWRVEYVKSARVWTVVPPTFGRLIRQQVRWKKSFIRNLCFTGKFYWRRGPLPIVLFYGHAVFVLATPIMAARHLVYMPVTGQWYLAGLYLIGVFFKGSVWALAYKKENPHCNRWIYRPFMSLMTAFLFSLLLVYSAVTLRRNAWARG